jgi:hypothetical protein
VFDPKRTSARAESNGIMMSLLNVLPRASSQSMFFQPQHPLSDAPAISLRFAEPPSVEGTGGGQMDEGGLAAVAVVLDACVDVSGISPGNSKGD